MTGAKGILKHIFMPYSIKKKFKTQVELRVAGEWFLCDVLNILTTSLYPWSADVREHVALLGCEANTIMRLYDRGESYL